jgi:hypothetical protein
MPIEVTLLGIVIEVKGVSPKARSPIYVTLFGIVIEAKEVPENDKFPIEVTVSGIVMDVTFECTCPSLPNARSPIAVAPTAITALPEQEYPAETTPSVIVYVGSTDDLRPVAQLYVPLEGRGATVILLTVLSSRLAV